MNLEKSVADEIISLAKKHGVKKVVLYGSRAKGTNSERSDIDLAISGGNFLDFAYDVDEEIPTLLKFDVVNLDKNLAPEFRAEIERYGVVIMEMAPFNNFVKSLNILLNTEKEQALTSEIYRMGVIGQFNLTFELAWKAVREVLELHGVSNFKTGSPREVLKTAYQFNFLGDEKIWLDMLKSRNIISHVYDEAAALELANAIFDSYMTALVNLRELLRERIADTEI